MRNRVRLLAALLALFAFSAYFVESVAASMCGPEASASHAAAAGPVTSDAHAGMHHSPAKTSHGSEAPAPEAPPCPLGMPGAGNSCVAVSLPGSPHAVGSGDTAASVDLLLPDLTVDRLLVDAHFRPPRA